MANIADHIHPNPSNEEALSLFLELIESRHLKLYHAQEAAILELYDEKNVILHTPTGSGKSLVAEALHFKSILQKRRSIYTSPTKALVNEKWFALCESFGAENVGLSTGDASVNRNAPILCCTAEILSNLALSEAAFAQIDDVIIDEFHYYSDRDRGVAWQVPLLTLSQSRFLLMSATLGETAFFEKALSSLNSKETITIKSTDRPVPLEFEYRQTPLSQSIEALIKEDKCPAYIVHFTQAEAATSAQDFTSINVCNKAEKQAITKQLEGFKFNTPYGTNLRKWLKHGIGLHHAGLLPKYRILIEQLAQAGFLKVICGTDTLGVGINVPIRTVIFSRLCKYDGQKTGILTARDFHQIAGRAGRKGFDEKGWVIAQAPEHVIENIKLEAKSIQTGKKFVKRKAPLRNFVHWDEKTFHRLISSSPERLISRFKVSHGMLICVLRRNEDGCKAMQHLIRNCHDSPNQKRQHRRRAWQLFRALVKQKIIDWNPDPKAINKVMVDYDLQADFSMAQTLSLYLHEALDLIDPQTEDYALVALSLVESILEDPHPILHKQLDKLKSEALITMKKEGLNFDQRMEELEKMEYPKPHREFIYGSFNDFSKRHPWVEEENIRPKSIAREMFESLRSFNDYIKDYGLQRVEGLLLRHLTSVYKTLLQTVPPTKKNETIIEIEAYLKMIIQQTDSSLVEEWERMKGSQLHEDQKENITSSNLESSNLQSSNFEKPDITKNEDEFIMMIRQRVLSFVKSLSQRNVEAAFFELHKDHNEGQMIPSSQASSQASSNETSQGFSKGFSQSLIDEVEGLLNEYYETHERICLDPEARNRRYCIVKKRGNQSWKLIQTLVDPAGFNDWFVEFEIDLAASKKADRPIIKFEKLTSSMSNLP